MAVTAAMTHPGDLNPVRALARSLWRTLVSLNGLILRADMYCGNDHDDGL